MGSLERKILRQRKRDAYKRFRKEFKIERDYRQSIHDASAVSGAEETLLGKTPRYHQWLAMMNAAKQNIEENKKKQGDFSKDVNNLEWEDEASQEMPIEAGTEPARKEA